MVPSTIAERMGWSQAQKSYERNLFVVKNKIPELQQFVRVEKKCEKLSNESIKRFGNPIPDSEILQICSELLAQIESASPTATRDAHVALVSLRAWIHPYQEFVNVPFLITFLGLAGGVERLLCYIEDNQYDPVSVYMVSDVLFSCLYGVAVKRYSSPKIPPIVQTKIVKKLMKRNAMAPFLRFHDRFIEPAIDVFNGTVSACDQGKEGIATLAIRCIWSTINTVAAAYECDAEIWGRDLVPSALKALEMVGKLQRSTISPPFFIESLAYCQTMTAIFICIKKFNSPSATWQHFSFLFRGILNGCVPSLARESEKHPLQASECRAAAIAGACFVDCFFDTYHYALADLNITKSCKLWINDVLIFWDWFLEKFPDENGRVKKICINLGYINEVGLVTKSSLLENYGILSGIGGVLRSNKTHDVTKTEARKLLKLLCS